MEPRRIYDLRSTFATRLNAAGVPQVFIEQLMGHAGGLAQMYAKANEEYRRAAIEKLEKLVAAGGVSSAAKTTDRPKTLGVVVQFPKKQVRNG